jgi:hypothetical protein
MEAKKLLQPILTEWHCSEVGGKAVVQLELIDRIFQPILHHKIRFDSYGSDRLVLEQRLILHTVQFQTERTKGEIGDFLETELEIDHLYSICERLKKTQHSCQVLLIQSNVLKIVRLEQFREFLPEKLKNIDFGVIAMRQMGLMDNHKIEVQKLDEPDNGSFTGLA